MVRIENVRKQISADGTSVSAVVDLQVSTAAELPAKDAQIGTIKVSPGSIAQVIQTGVFYTLDANGTWYDDSGNAAS